MDCVFFGLLCSAACANVCGGVCVTRRDGCGREVADARLVRAANAVLLYLLGFVCCYHMVYIVVNTIVYFVLCGLAQRMVLVWIR